MNKEIKMTDNRKDEMPLKPCPFCGGDANCVNEDNEDLHSYVCCKDCGACSGIDYVCPARTQWNTRADISPQVPDDVAEAVKYAQIEVDRIKLDMAQDGTVPAFNARVSYHHLKPLIRASSTPSAEVSALRAALEEAFKLANKAGWHTAEVTIPEAQEAYLMMRDALNHTERK